MMRIAALALCIATPAVAYGWEASVTFGGQPYNMTGTRNSIDAGSNGMFFSAEAFVEGLDAGAATCDTARTFEVDFYYGIEPVFVTHVLFTLHRDGSGYQVVDPTVFHDAVTSFGEEETYAEFGTVAVGLSHLGCQPDGTLALQMNFKGNPRSEMGQGTDTLQMSGTATGDLILRDMNEY